MITLTKEQIKKLENFGFLPIDVNNTIFEVYDENKDMWSHIETIGDDILYKGDRYSFDELVPKLISEYN